ncbi:Cytochrome c551 peroxidase [Labilithrix luteola]|uniref:Cytochrome c551 peroxidase n=1 Tax=Labilithrix luteola TaxID=1391654 RepID=A0A0K1PWR7_9BACT|nr:cytochrome c peroxidase [Labilithrix luteola]AKU97579.1 Cytochrome c551 peroxidase [Labilithrix luteola]
MLLRFISKRPWIKPAVGVSLGVLVAAACAHEKPSNVPSGGGPAAQGGAPSSTGEVSDAAAASFSMAHVPKDLPIGVSPTLYALSVSPANVPTPDKVALGDKLFDDKRLSVDGTVSCATCHEPKRGFVDHKVTSEGVGKQRGQRNAPTILNAMFGETQFWDGRAPTLEEQAKLPILNPIEMGQKSPADVVAKLRGIPEYVDAFQTVFGREVNYDDLASAIAAFERTLYSGDAPFDRYIQGEEKAIDASARRGWALFNGKGRCNSCHAGNAISPLFSDQKFHNIGIAAHKQNFPELAREAMGIVQLGNEKQIDELALETKFSELGRFLVTKQVSDVGGFKTPTLRNIAVTAPYMHDGSLATLWDVMDHYNKGGIPNPFLDGGMQRLGLIEAEIDDLVKFMTTLTSEKFAALGRAEMAKQTALKGTRPQRDTAVAMGKKGDLGDIAPDPDLKVKNPADIGAFGVYVDGGR